MRTPLIMLLVFAAALPAQADKPKKPKKHSFSVANVTCEVPADWKSQKTSSKMRLGVWRLPAKSDQVDVIVYWFGKGGAGNLLDNLNRWKSQIKTDTDPKPQKIAVTKQITAHLIDARGTYVAPVRPGATERNNKADSRLLAAVIETPGGPLYVKAVGSAKTLDAQEKAFMAWLKSFKSVVEKKK